MAQKIVHVMISCFYIEGAGYQENLIPRCHKRMGMDVTIITTQYCFDDKYQRKKRASGYYTNKDGIKVVVLKDNKHLPFKLGSYQRKSLCVYDTLLSEKPDIIFMHGMNAKDGIDIVNYVKDHKGVKLFADHHSDYYNSSINKGLWNKIRFVLLIRPIAHKVARYATKVWGTTPWRVQHLREVYGIPKEKTELLIMGADETKINWEQRNKIRKEFRKKYGIKDDDFLIVTGGKINKEKGTHILTEAVSSLNNPQVKLVIFGTPDDSMTTILQKYAESTSIITIGWIPSDKVYDIFLAADLGCFPGTHSVLWEQAVACGLPTIFKLWEGMKHVQVNGNALLMKNITPNYISDEIMALVTDKKRYASMKHAALECRTLFYYSEISKRAIGI